MAAGGGTLATKLLATDHIDSMTLNEAEPNHAAKLDQTTICLRVARLHPCI